MRLDRPKHSRTLEQLRSVANCPNDVWMANKLAALFYEISDTYQTAAQSLVSSPSCCTFSPEPPSICPVPGASSVCFITERESHTLSTHSWEPLVTVEAAQTLPYESNQERVMREAEGTTCTQSHTHTNTQKHTTHTLIHTHTHLYSHTHTHNKPPVFPKSFCAVHGFSRVTTACEDATQCPQHADYNSRRFACVSVSETLFKVPSWPSIWLSVARVRRNSERLVKETPERTKQKLAKKAASSANLLTRSPSLERWGVEERCYDRITVQSVPDLNMFPLIGILGSVGVVVAQVWIDGVFCACVGAFQCC